MQSTDIKDKLIIDPSKIEGLPEMLSRAEPGDEFTGAITMALDEAGEKTATFSITKATVKMAGDDEAVEKTPDSEAEEGEETPASTSAAAKLFSGPPDNEAGADGEK